MNAYSMILDVLSFVFVTTLLFCICYAFIAAVFLSINLSKIIMRFLNQIVLSIQKLHVKLCRLMINWERLFLVTLSISLVLVMVLTWIGRYNQPAGLGQDDHWFFEGLRVVFDVLEGDSLDFRKHASFCPILPAVLSILVPLSAVGSVLALLWHYLPHHVPCFNRVWYIFSELEPNSIRMAKSIQSDLGTDTGVFIFLRTRRDNLPPEMLMQLRKLNYFLYSKDEIAFLFWPWRRRRILRFFYLSENTDMNFNRMRSFLEHVGEKELFTHSSTNMPDGRFQHELYLLSETESAPMLIDYLRSSLQQAKNPNTFRNTELRLLDRFRAVSYDLIRQKPLLMEPTDETNLNVLVLGFGKIGREFFRAASSVWITHGCVLSFTLCDLDIHRKHNAYIQQCPELDQSVHYQLNEMDAESNQLEELIVKNNYHYILVALGDDERNIRVASWLKRHYRKRHWETENISQPQICVNIEDSIKHEYVQDLWSTKATWDRPLHVFGGLDQAFSKAVLMPQNLWLAARWIHRELNGLPSDAPMIWSEYQRRSSIACAAHAEYHSTVLPTSTYRPEELANTEHNRWMAYVRSEGMQKADMSLVNKYFEEVGSHVDTLGRVTPCLVGPDELIDVQEFVNFLRNIYTPDSKNVRSFQERDAFIVAHADKIRACIQTGVAYQSGKEVIPDVENAGILSHIN